MKSLLKIYTKPQTSKESVDATFRKRILVRASVGFCIIVIAGTLVRHLVSPMPVRILATNAVIALVLLLPIWLERRRTSPFVLALPLAFGIDVILINGGLVAGGIHAPISVLIPLLPIMGFCFGGRSLGIGGLVTSVVLSLGFVVAEHYGLTAPVLDPGRLSSQRLVMILTMALVAYVTGRIYEASRSYAEQKLVESSNLASLGTLAGGIAHEINNPLAIVMGFANQLQKMAKSGVPIDPEKINDLSRRLAGNTQRIANVVSGLMSYARDDASSPLASVKLKDIVNNASIFCSERFKNANIELRIGNIGDDVLIMARTGQITDVMLGLLNNAFDAVKAMPDPWVALECVVKSNIVELSVTDSGLGIDRHLQSKIFTPFFTTKDVGHGTGLGLSICAAVMSQHGGDIFLDEKSKHTRFVLHFVSGT